MTIQTVETPAPARKSQKTRITLILAAEVRRRLGNVSRSTLYRIERDDPRFPKGTRVRGQNAWDEEEIDRYAREVLARGDAAAKGDS